MGPGSYVSEDDTISTVSNDTLEEVTGFMKKFTALQTLQHQQQHSRSGSGEAASSPHAPSSRANMNLDKHIESMAHQNADQLLALEKAQDDQGVEDEEDASTIATGTTGDLSAEFANLPECKFKALLNLQAEEDEMVSLSGKQIFQKRFDKQRRINANSTTSTSTTATTSTTGKGFPNRNIRKPLTLPGQPQPTSARPDEDATFTTGCASQDETILSALPDLVSPLSSTSTLMTSSTFGRPMASRAAAEAALPPLQPIRRGTLQTHEAMAVAAAFAKGGKDSQSPSMDQQPQLPQRSRIRSSGSTLTQSNQSGLEEDSSTLGSHLLSSSQGEDTAEKLSLPPLEGMTEGDAEDDDAEADQESQGSSDDDDLSISGIKLRQKKLRQEESKRRLLSNSHGVQAEVSEKRKQNLIAPARSRSPDPPDDASNSSDYHVNNNNNNYRNNIHETLQHNCAIPNRPGSPAATQSVFDDEESLSPILVKAAPEVVQKALKKHLSVPDLRGQQHKDDEEMSLSAKKLIEKKQRKEQLGMVRRSNNIMQPRYANFQMGSKALSVSNLETMLHNLTDSHGRPPVINEHFAAVQDDVPKPGEPPTIKFERRRSEVSEMSGITWEFSEATSTVPSMASYERIPSGMAAAAAAARRWDSGCPGDINEDDDDDDDDEIAEDANNELVEEDQPSHSASATGWKVRADNKTMVFQRSPKRSPTAELKPAVMSNREKDDSLPVEKLDSFVAFLLDEAPEIDDTEEKIGVRLDSSVRSAPERGSQIDLEEDDFMKDRSKPGLLNVVFPDKEDDEVAEAPSSDGTPEPGLLKEFVQSAGAAEKDKGKASDPRSLMKKFKKQLSLRHAKKATNKYLKFGGEKKKSGDEKLDHMFLVDGMDDGDEVLPAMTFGMTEEPGGAVPEASFFDQFPSTGLHDSGDLSAGVRSASYEEDSLFRAVSQTKSPVKANNFEHDGTSSQSPLAGQKNSSLRQPLKRDNVGSVRRLMRFPFGRSSSVPNLFQEKESFEDETEDKRDHGWNLAQVPETSEETSINEDSNACKTDEASSANADDEAIAKSSKSQPQRRATKQDTPPTSPSGRPKASSSRKTIVKRRHSGGGLYRKPSLPEEDPPSSRRSSVADHDSARRNNAREECMISSKAASSRRLTEKKRRSSSVGRSKKSSVRSSDKKVHVSSKSSSTRDHDDQRSPMIEEFHSSGEATATDRSSRRSKRSSAALKAKPSSTRNADDRSQSSRKSSRKAREKLHGSSMSALSLEEDDVVPELPQDLVKGDDGRRSSKKSLNSSRRSRDKMRSSSSSTLEGDEEVPKLPNDLVSTGVGRTSMKKSIASKSTKRQSNVTKSRKSEVDQDLTGGRMSTKTGSRKSIGPRPVSTRKLVDKSTPGEDKSGDNPEALPPDLVFSGRPPSRPGSRKSLGPKTASVRQRNKSTPNEDKRAIKPERKLSSHMGPLPATPKEPSQPQAVSERQDMEDASRSRGSLGRSKNRQPTRAKAGRQET